MDVPSSLSSLNIMELQTLHASLLDLQASFNQFDAAGNNQSWPGVLERLQFLTGKFQTSSKHVAVNLKQYAVQPESINNPSLVTNILLRTKLEPEIEEMIDTTRAEFSKSKADLKPYEMQRELEQLTANINLRNKTIAMIMEEMEEMSQSRKMKIAAASELIPDRATQEAEQKKAVEAVVRLIARGPKS